MKAILTGVALAALIAGAPAVAGERLQLAQAEPQSEPLQEEMPGATECPEGATETTEGLPCPSDDAAAAPEEPADESEAAGAPEEEPATTTGELPAEGEETEATEMVAEGGLFIDEQGDDAILASELVGRTVYNTADEALGDVNDVLWTDDGVEAVIIGVGGFLGIGERSIAVVYSEIDVTTDENGNKKLVLNTSAEELAAAPDFLSTAEKLAMIRAEQQQALPPAGGGGMTPAPAPEPIQ